MKVLECSSKGDKRFSAFYAYIEYDDIYDSIESIYQSVKRNEIGEVAGKGKKVDYVIIKDKMYEPGILTSFYKLLWIKYFNNNKELLDVIREYDDFSDMFSRNVINSQSDVIKEIKEKGLNKMFREVIKEYNSYKEMI